MKTLMMAVAAVCCAAAANTDTTVQLRSKAEMAGARCAEAERREGCRRQSRSDAQAPARTAYATIETSLGNIELELDAAKAPLSVTNFMTYAKAGHYDGTVFHRVINGFMVQGGGFTKDMVQKETRAPIKNEAANGLKNKRGTIAMARTPAVDSATSQFFINHKDNAFLDHVAPNPRQFGYAVFGHVTKGMDVVDKIAQVKTGRIGYFSDVPVEPVVIKRVTVWAERADITSGLQREIDAAWQAGGGTVRVPAGDWGVRSIRLRSGVTLHLAAGAHLWASRSPRDFDGVIENDAVEKFAGYPTDLGKGAWENAIVKIYAATNVVIVGEKGSFIDGQNCADPTGEEGYRGPHGIWAACSTNVTLQGVTLRNTGNWSMRLIHCADLTVDGATVLGGHDGVDVHASDRVLIANCTLNTGDDSVAGYANRNVLVTNCFLRSACSPFRIGGRDVLIADCRAIGPADYPHRWTLTAEEKARGAGPDEVKGRRTTGCAFQPFTDLRLRTWLKPGNIVFRNVTFENANHFMVFLNGLGALWQNGPAVEDITFENCTMRGMAAPSVVYAPEKEPLKLVFRNCTFGCASYQPVALLHKNVNLVAEDVKVENAGVFARAKDDLSFADVPDFPSWQMESNEQRAKWGLPPLPASR